MLNIMGLKSRNLISLPLDIPNVDVRSVEMNKRGDYIITVESNRVGTICQHCGRKIKVQRPRAVDRVTALVHFGPPCLYPSTTKTV